MQLVDGAMVLSATDLNNYLACEHLTTLDLSVLRKEIARPEKRPGQASLLAELGEQHEQAYLAKLRADGHTVVTIERSGGIVAAAEATERAMRDGAPIIYQATFFDGTWLGHADFLRRVDEPREGARWDWHYEVEDTKLARHTEPYFLLQLCYYSEHVERVQGVAPRSMYVVSGDGKRKSFLVADFDAYYRSVKARFLQGLADGAATYPVPGRPLRAVRVGHGVRTAPAQGRPSQSRRRDFAASDGALERRRYRDARGARRSDGRGATRPRW